MTKSLMPRSSRRTKPPPALTKTSFAKALSVLTRSDTALARVIQLFGPPPMWRREPGFHTLIHIILEQQVSLASAKAAYDRLLAIASPLTPERFLKLDDTTLKGVGFSRQKTDYCRGLATSLADGRFNLTALESMTDENARVEMIKMKGVGSWTADIYLLMALRRPDIWPTGDLALAIAAQRLMKLPDRPTPEELNSIGERWKPWRAVAARVLWHYYLSECVKTNRT